MIYFQAAGVRLAFENLNCKIVAFCEINKFAVQLYKAYFNTDNEVYFPNATEIDSRLIPEFDILTAGFPCQSFSIAGARKGFDDNRGALFFEIARILRDCKPKYFLLENVKGLLNIDDKRTFITIIETLTDIGYTVEWCLLNTKHFGLPHNRERIFIVGYLRKKCSSKIFPIEKYTNKHSKENKELLLYWQNSKNKWVLEKRKTVPTLKTQTEYCRQTILLKSGTLRTHSIDNGFREMKQIICPTIPARAREDGSGQPVLIFMGKLKKIIGCFFSARRLTPIEAFRLQGFPDDIVKKGYEIGISDSQLYKMAGNTVSTNVVYEIAKRIIELESMVNNG